MSIDVRVVSGYALSIYFHAVINRLINRLICTDNDLKITADSHL